MTCKVIDCGRLVGKHGAKKMCPMHYKRSRSGYDIYAPPIKREWHSMSNSSEYKIWQGMKDRCSNKNTKFYKNYGGRGIKVCERWERSFQNFIADMGKRPSKHHSIDRIDNEGDYAPDNCRWSTMPEQAHNMRVRNRFGLAGIYFDRNRYKVEITVMYKNVYIGRYETLEEALSARMFAEDYYW